MEPDYFSNTPSDSADDYPEPGTPLAASKDFGVQELARGPRTGAVTDPARANVTGITGQSEPPIPSDYEPGAT